MTGGGLRREKTFRFREFLIGVGPMMGIWCCRKAGPDMTTDDIWKLADACIEAGHFPRLRDRLYVLVLQVPGTGRAVLHRKEVSFRLYCPCRVWLMSGRIRLLLGDSIALPGDLASGIRPPYTG